MSTKIYGRRNDIQHFLSANAPHLPEPDRRSMQGSQPRVRGTDYIVTLTMSRRVGAYSDQQDAAVYGEPVEQPLVQRIDVRQLQYIGAFGGHHMVP